MTNVTKQEAQKLLMLTKKAIQKSKGVQNVSPIVLYVESLPLLGENIGDNLFCLFFGDKMDDIVTTMEESGFAISWIADQMFMEYSDIAQATKNPVIIEKNAYMNKVQSLLMKQQGHLHSIVYNV